MTLEELFKNKKQNNLDQFINYLLNKLKRDLDFTIKLEKGYIMAGYKCYIINDNIYTKNETKKYLLEILTN